VQFYFDILSKGTALQGAVLFFKRIVPEYVCKECGHVFTGRDVGSLCPKCGGKSVVANKGQEFYIESIEVDDSED
jgi:hydrogenase nickel incorporation protein HypA/HybF